MSINLGGITVGCWDSVVERVNENVACYRWKVNEFRDLEKSPHLSIFGPFITADNCRVEWRLQLYPNGKSKKLDDFMTVSVDYYTEIDNLMAAFELSIVNNDNQVMERFKSKNEMKLIIDREAEYRRLIDGGHYRLPVRRSYVENPRNRLLSADGCCTISFDVTYRDRPVVIMSFGRGYEIFNELDDYRKLLENGLFSDVKFVVGDKEIRAHKAILAIRSPVFQAMFASEMREKKQNIVEIVDIDHAVLMELFRFMYTGVVHEIEKVACDLLVAAEKYCVERLKFLCERTLLGNLKIDNVVKCFSAADACNAKQLRERAFTFILNHVDEIVDRDEFTSLNSTVMREILCAVLPKKRSN